MTKLKDVPPPSFRRRQAANIPVEQQIEWVKQEWRKNPRISINGTNGMSDRMLTVFGRAIRTDELARIKVDINREMNEAMQQVKDGSNGHGPMNPVIKAADVPRVVKALEPQAPPAPSSPAPAPKSVSGKPGSTKSHADHVIRREFCRRYYEQHPTATSAEVRDACVREYGIGIDNIALGDCRRDAGIMRGLQVGSEAHQRWRERNAPAERRELARPVVTLKAAPVQSPADAIRAAVELLMESVPGLQSLSVTIADGRPKFRYSVQTVSEGEESL